MMIPFAIPSTLSARQRRAARAWYQVHLARLRRAEQIGDRAKVAEEQHTLAVLAGLLAEGRCPNRCGRNTSSRGVRISLFGVGLGRCCDACSADLQDARSAA